jgi:hypothetical protein
MGTTPNSIETLFESIEAYSKTSYELSKLKALDATSSIAASLVSRIVIILIVGLFIFILSIGIALMIGEALGKPYYGFFIVAGFYLIAVIIAYYSLGNVIKKSINKLIVAQLV